MGLMIVPGLLVLAAASLAAAAAASAWWLFAAVPLLLLLALGIRDLIQREHSILRNFPVLGHMRFLLESIRPELQQYFIERNYDGRPYDRDTRTVIYQRAKGITASRRSAPSATSSSPATSSLVHSTAPREPSRSSRRASGSAAPTARSPTTWPCSTSPR